MSAPENSKSNRRTFIKSSSTILAAGALVGSNQLVNAAHPFGDETIKIGLVGCGGRGTGAVDNALNTAGPVKLVAVGDVFDYRVRDCLNNARLQEAHADKMDVPADRQFVGLDAYQKVLNCDIDLVILATPPGFRPLHFEAAIAAGKHVFMEKPVAVDPAGIQRVLAAGRKASQANLGVAVGIQRRHEKAYQETINRIHDGMIGDIVATRVYWNSAGVWVRKRKPEQSELEYQLDNWYYFNWLCGDHIVEQHIHNLDVGNWIKQALPVEANGMGGRLVRTGIDHGQIFDHHSVEYTYEDGSKMFSQCRHMPGTASHVAEYAHGTKGNADVSKGILRDIAGKEIWSFGRGGRGGHQQEHHDLFANLRRGELPNETEYGATSTMTAILGRMATYSGQVEKFQAAMESGAQLCNVDQLASMTDSAPVQPDDQGRYPIPVPGEYRLAAK